VYDIERNSDWNSNSWANKRNGNPKTILKEKDWGYSIGGPVGKPGGSNKLFFFFSQEWRPRTTGGQVTRFRVPTELERQGDFSQSRDNNGALFPYIRDYTTGLTCSASDTRGCFQDGGVVGRIPQSRLYGIGLNVLKYWPMPNDSAGYAATGSYNYQSIKPTVDSHGRQEAFRADYQFSPKLRASGKLLTQDNSTEANNANIRFGTGTTSLIPGFNDMTDWVPLMLQWSGTVNYNLNASTYIEGSYGGFYNQIATTPLNDTSNKDLIGLGAFPMLFPDADILDERFYSSRILSSLADRGVAPPYFVNGRMRTPPIFNWGSRVSNAPPNVTDFGCCFTLNRVQNITISLTKVLGRHTAKAGFYIDDSYKPQSAGVGATGSYRGTVGFGNDANNPLDSGFGFANAALGIFSSYQQANRFLEGNYVYRNTEWYVQDNWRVNGKLTLDYGLRFVHQPPQYDTYGFSSNFLEDQWNPAMAPVLFRPVCAPGTAAPCTGQNVRALNPLTNTILGPGSSAVVGQIVPNSGDLTNGVFPAGTGPVVKENYTWPALVLAPRFGYAYDLTGTQSVVLRGGAGVFYDRPDGNSMFGQITNPPASQSVTVNNGELANLTGGLQVSAPPGLTIFEYDAKMPTSVQWNTGLQFNLPWASVMDVEYVGNHSYNLLEQTDINAPDFGAAYQPQNQNPTLAPNPLAGANALPTNFYRPYGGYGGINRLDRRLQQLPLAADVVEPALPRRPPVHAQLHAEPEQGDRRQRRAHHPRREQQHRAPRRLRGGELPDHRQRPHTRGEGQLRVGHARPAAIRDVLVHHRGRDQRLAAVGNLHRRLGRSVHRRLQLSGRHRRPDSHGHAELQRSHHHHRRPGEGMLERSHTPVQYLGLRRTAAWQPGPRVGAQLHARVPGQDFRLRDRAKHQSRGESTAAAAGRAVQRLQRGDHHRAQRDDEHCEPGHGVDGDEPAVRRRGEPDSGPGHPEHRGIRRGVDRGGASESASADSVSILRGWQRSDHPSVGGTSPTFAAGTLVPRQRHPGYPGAPMRH
jgi:hypothetical protein